ncbi:MAG: cytochrome c biogenesis protein CcsA, partial [Ignavibacteriaceae bacterium]|nr:cytochrome c biogenesis protein CcsA [Ignavibacteriaceae bacterium]
LAGFIFMKRSPIVLAATALLASITLMVAHLSWMDPQISNLVPVLKSYWLTIHVSVITASYGFLGLGALLGFLNLILMLMKNPKNRDYINITIDELSVVNHMTLIIGLYLLTIGTFLGAVWANESWGRYWGWDPKETWALITVIVYTLVLHTRFIPALNKRYAFNLMSHILNAHIIWINRIKNEEIKVSPFTIHDTLTLSSKNLENYENTLSILVNNDNSKIIHYRNTKGEKFINTVAGILHHIINHSTYHRGQISIALKQEDIPVPVSDYIAYLREKTD